MDVQMFAPQFALTPSLREYLEHRLRFAFARTRKHVARIAVRLRDLNGPGGGRDMMCQISVSIPGRPEVVVREVQEDMVNAIDLALKRAAHRAMRLVMSKRRPKPEVRDHG